MQWRERAPAPAEKGISAARRQRRLHLSPRNARGRVDVTKCRNFVLFEALWTRAAKLGVRADRREVGGTLCRTVNMRYYIFGNDARAACGSGLVRYQPAEYVGLVASLVESLRAGYLGKLRPCLPHWRAASSANAACDAGRGGAAPSSDDYPSAEAGRGKLPISLRVPTAILPKFKVRFSGIGRSSRGPIYWRKLPPSWQESKVPQSVVVSFCDCPFRGNAPGTRSRQPGGACHSSSN